MQPQSTLSLLTWARDNLPAVESLCDEAAALDPPGEVTTPTLVDLSPAEREAESLLLSCLECRPLGLDPKTPSRTREWLWRGLNGMELPDPSAPAAPIGQGGE